MYRRSKSLVRKFIFVQGLSVLLVLASTFQGQAQTISNLPAPSSDVSVKFLGEENDMMVFSVHFTNEKESKYNVSIYNNAGDILFRDVFEVRSFDKKFKVPKENGRLDLVVANVTDKVTRNIKIGEPATFTSARVR
jgi:hypothetical protein